MTYKCLSKVTWNCDNLDGELIINPVGNVFDKTCNVRYIFLIFTKLNSETTLKI